MIRPYLKKKYSPLCNITTPITNQLFGDDLSKEMKKCETSVSVARYNYNYGQFSGSEVKIGAVVEAGFHIEVMATRILVIPSKDMAEAAGTDIIHMLDQISSDSLKCWRQKRDQGLQLWLIPAIY